MKILTAGWGIGNHENKRGDDGHKGRGWGRWGVGRWKGAGVGWGRSGVEWVGGSIKFIEKPSEIIYKAKKPLKISSF
jgi:hypothetical protein